MIKSGLKKAKLSFSAAIAKDDAALVESVKWHAGPGVHDFYSPPMPLAQARQVEKQLVKKGIKCEVLCDLLDGHTNNGTTVVTVKNATYPHYHATISKSWHYLDDKGRPTGPAIRSEIKRVKRKDVTPQTDYKHIDKFFAAFPGVKVEGVETLSNGVRTVRDASPRRDTLPRPSC